MEQLKNRIITNYTGIVSRFIKEIILKKGFVRTPNKRIYQLNVFTINFEEVNIEDMLNLIKADVPNIWNIPLDIQDKLIVNALMDLLPVASTLELNHFTEFVINSKNLINPKDLDKDVKKLFQENKKKQKAIFKGGYNAPEYQAQALINNDVIYCKLLGAYYIFVKNRKQFVKLTSKDILKYIKADYPNANLTKVDIADYMQSSYLFFVTNSDLPKIYNENQGRLMKLNEYERDYKKVNMIVSRFE